MAMNWEIKKEMVNDAAEKIKSYGYRVFVYTDDKIGVCYGFFSDGNYVGYFQSDWNAYLVSMYGTPSVEVIDGFRHQETNITKEICERAVSGEIPMWAMRAEPYPILIKLHELLNIYKNNDRFKEI